MPDLSYTAITSLDGFIEDPGGKFDWAMPDPELHEYFNGIEASIGIHLFGRRMYETMAVWETVVEGPGVSPEEVEFAAVWKTLDKVVYSRTLTEVTTSRTRLEHEFDPEAVRQMKVTADRDLSISGPDLARHAFRAGLVDHVHLFLFPVVVGGGKPGLPSDVAFDLELVGSQTFSSGVVHLHHRPR